MKHNEQDQINQKEPARFVRVSANLMGHFANWKFDPSRTDSILNDVADFDLDDQV
jgi:predicted XRE-type DNA-binding protein